MSSRVWLRSFLCWFPVTVLAPVAYGSSVADLRAHDAVVEQFKSQSQDLQFDLPGYVQLLDDTVTKLVDRNPNLGPEYPMWVLPSPVYPETYVRDTFWALTGFGDRGLQKQFVEMFGRNAQSAGWEPPLAGQIPTIVRKGMPMPPDGRRADESTLFWVIGAKISGRTVQDLPYLAESHKWLRQHVTPQGSALISHGWIDAWEPTKEPVVSANNQGLYVVTLRALKDMGVDVSTEELNAAIAAYKSLFQDGYLNAYLGRGVVDVSSLIGETLSLILWDESILSSEMVLGTVSKFSEVFYRDGEFLGYKVLSQLDGSYLDPKEFWEIAERDPGNYQNGGSWLLYEALALYAATRHDVSNPHSHYAKRFIQRLKSELRYEHSSKEFICTGGTCGSCEPVGCLCPDNICGLGGFRYNRSVYAWNTFIKRLILTRKEFMQQER